MPAARIGPIGSAQLGVRQILRKPALQMFEHHGERLVVQQVVRPGKRHEAYARNQCSELAAAFERRGLVPRREQREVPSGPQGGRRE